MNYCKMSCRMILLSFFVFVSITTLLSCKKKEEAPSPSSDQFEVAVPANEPAGPESAPEAAPAESSEGAPRQNSKRKIIMSHDLTMEVKSFSVALESLTKLAEVNGGYVFQTSRSIYDRKSYSGVVGIRIPSGKARGVLEALRGLGRIESENSNAEDITDQYVDMEARLKNAQASEARLKEMYQRAGTVKDILAVEKELTRVRGDIEAFMAQKRNWDILVEMVTIQVNLHEPSAAMPAAHSFWEPIRSAFGTALEAFANSLRALIIFTGVIVPWLVIIVPGCFLLVRLIKRRRNRKKKEANAAAEV